MEHGQQQESATAPDVSVIVPIYNEAESIADTLQELMGVLRKMDQRTEILAINDGSTDETLTILRSLTETIPVLRIFSLVPNVGQSAAFGVGFRRAAARGPLRPRGRLPTRGSRAADPPARLPGRRAAFRPGSGHCRRPATEKR